MKLSRKWMNEDYVDLSSVSDSEFAETLTRFGREVEICRSPIAGDSSAEFTLPKDRPDLCSAMGLAREAAAAFGLPMHHHVPQVEGSDAGSIFEYLDVDVPEETVCGRYSARMVANVIVGPSPLWLRQRLEACGIEPVSNLVDIASLVSYEYGQPVGLLDFRQLPGGSLVIRQAMEGEAFLTAAGKGISLRAGMPVYTDGEQILGLAGMPAGSVSGLREDSSLLILDAGNFDGSALRQSALALELGTVTADWLSLPRDPMMTMPALDRACELVEKLGCGDVLDGSLDVLNYVPQPRTLPLDTAEINRLLETNLSREDMISCLNLLEIPVSHGEIQLPSFRPDLQDLSGIAAEIRRCHECRCFRRDG